ncbi:MULTISPECIES: GNAT family N-acetyltransferase [unclassified Sphingobium]|uniref:GNAT family N-acetyltransferase n=1 Tax=unclassified Sphingobium TaxID=2611147 RepID=UPI0029CAB131|nr:MULTISPECIES: GNAT family N-acetyltransferase [unclassified Sphingobium]MCW2382813.1 GNAT superfamily N-acetyltransferase [Sphingobium sp. B2D3B]
MLASACDFGRAAEPVVSLAMPSIRPTNQPMPLHITVPEQPSEADRNAVFVPLLAYNIAQAGNPNIRPIAILLTDEQGERVGGIWGKCSYDWMFVELLAIAPEHRGGGHGKALMAEAERVARAHGCVGIWLDTYAFQARGFYEKLGFSVFGTLDDHPVGQQRFFLSKRL